jgi:hypothetical protein
MRWPVLGVAAPSYLSAGLLGDQEREPGGSQREQTREWACQSAPHADVPAAPWHFWHRGTLARGVPCAYQRLRTSVSMTGWVP